MEIFYTTDIDNTLVTLSEEESKHCIKVLRHTEGDKIEVIDGLGTLYSCTIISAKKSVVCNIDSMQEGFGTHPYHLTMAVAPTKNIDRYEWFLEKATELGMDMVVPVIGEHSERKIVKPERCERILLSATKQSLKATLPKLEPLTTVTEFIKSTQLGGSTTDLDNNCPQPIASKVLKLIAYCGEATKKSLTEAVTEYVNEMREVGGYPKIVVLIGPEGDFSPKEVEAAIAAGFTPIHLGASRLRTETAAVAAVSGIYFNF